MDSPRTNEEISELAAEGADAPAPLPPSAPRPPRFALAPRVRVHKRTEGYVVSGSRSITPSLNDIMEALADANIYKMGVCGKDDEQMASLLERVIRRAKRDNLFGVTVMVSIKKNRNLTIIQQEIADKLGLCFEGQGKEDKTTTFWGCAASDRKNNVAIENATQLYDRIMKKPNILFILRDLHERIDLDKLGIPFGAVHRGCKLILTSESEEVLSSQMNTQRMFKSSEAFRLGSFKEI